MYRSATMVALVYLDGGNSIFFYFHLENWGRWTHFDEHIFQRGLETTNQIFTYHEYDVFFMVLL